MTAHPIISRQPQTTLERLDVLLASGLLSGQQEDQCRGLADALRNPARVAILAPRAAEGMALLNSVLAEDLVPIRDDLPAVEVCYGAQSTVKATLGSGQTMMIEGLLLSQLRHGCTWCH